MNPFNQNRFRNEHQLGDAYKTVRSVYEAMEIIQFVADNIRNFRSGNVELKSEGLNIFWKYEKSTEWVLLGDFSSLFQDILNDVESLQTALTSTNESLTITINSLAQTDQAVSANTSEISQNKTNLEQLVLDLGELTTEVGTLTESVGTILSDLVTVRDDISTALQGVSDNAQALVAMDSRVTALEAAGA